MSGRIAREDSIQTVFIIEADFCSYDAVTALVKYLQGHMPSAFACVEGMEDTALIDFGALAANLEIPSLEFVTNSRLPTLLIDGGHFPNRPMMIHGSVVCQKNDHIRQLLGDSFFLNLTHSPVLHRKFDDRKRLSCAELAEGMWLSELRETVEAVTSVEQLTNRTKFDIARANWVDEKVEASGVLQLIVDGVASAVDQGALDTSSVYTFYCGDENDAVSKFHYLKERGYLRSSIQLPLVRPARSTVIQSDSKAAKNPAHLLPSSTTITSDATVPDATTALPRKRKTTSNQDGPTKLIRLLPGKSTNRPSSNKNKAFNLADQQGVSTSTQVSNPEKENLDPLTTPSVAKATVQSKAKPNAPVYLHCADGVSGPYHRETIIQQVPWIQGKMHNKPFLSALHLDAVTVSVMTKFIGYVKKPENHDSDWTKWHLKDKLSVTALAEAMHATSILDQMLALLGEDFKQCVMNLSTAAWVFGNRFKNLRLEEFVANALHYVLTRNGVDVRVNFNHVVSGATGIWTARGRKMLMNALDKAQKKYGGEEKLEEHPCNGFAYAVADAPTGTWTQKFQGVL